MEMSYRRIRISGTDEGRPGELDVGALPERDAVVQRGAERLASGINEIKQF